MLDGLKATFIANYVACFLGARAGVNYDDYCARGLHDELTAKQPIEDAMFQANEAWKLLVNQPFPRDDD